MSAPLLVLHRLGPICERDRRPRPLDFGRAQAQANGLGVAASRESAHNAGDGVVPLEGHEGGLATEATQVPVAHLNTPWGQPAVGELIGQERLKLFR